MAKDASFELERPTDHNMCWVPRRQYLPLLIRWLFHFVFHLLVLISVDGIGWNSPSYERSVIILMKRLTFFVQDTFIFKNTTLDCDILAGMYVA